ncbi:hypothetical protein AB0B31_14425 [Catellatospora citrea]|uniref:hypothetical protein n=1 Tax=Catellatospora citrea TaxID=53366 RepID=UPI0033FFB372
MFDGLHDIDWSAMHHAYGTAEEVPGLLAALRSADAGTRQAALLDFYNRVHHQGDVYPCTAASLPFLFALAGDPGAPDRAAVVELLVSIGTSAVAYGRHHEVGDGAGGYPGAAKEMREHADDIVEFASDDDPQVRWAAIPGLGLFLEDGARALAVLRERLSAAADDAERVLVVTAAATLALRLPASSPEVTAWLDTLAAAADEHPVTRLAAMIQGARCAPDQIGDDLVTMVIGQLRRLAYHPARRAVPEPATPQSAEGMPPQVVAAFAELDRSQRVSTPTTDLLRTFHEVLGARVPQRTALLAEQLRSGSPGARLDALRMSGDLMRDWRGDHTSLLRIVAKQLDPADDELAAQAAEILESCHPIASSARHDLAAYVGAQRAEHGPQVWASPQPELRRSHQTAVQALARLGDERAVPSVLAALDSGVDAWRAVQVAGHLPMAAEQLVPRLCDHLRRIDLTQERTRMSVGSLLSALATLGNPAALPLIVDTLGVSVHGAQQQNTSSALNALAAFGPAAEPALELIRPLTADPDAHVRRAAVGALWAVDGDREAIFPLVREMLDESITFLISTAAGVLGQLGPPAIAALPRLRELLSHSYEWVRVPCAAAIWEIGGSAEAPPVLDTLLRAWARNPATGNDVVACLGRMGQAAAPALPRLREQLELPERGGRFASIDNDEKLQRDCRAILARFAEAGPPH